MSVDDIERRRQADELRRNMERQAAEQKRQQAAAQSKKETDDWVDAIRRGSRIHESYSASRGYSSAGEDHPIISALRTIFAFIVILFTIGIIIGIASYVYPPLGDFIAPFTDPIWIYLGDRITELNSN